MENVGWVPGGELSTGSPGTKLDHDNPAYKALSEKHFYTGPATVFGQNYQASYAPLIGEDGKLTGALFVGVPK
jgi:methyl-accepting chemotaxis protein